MLHVGLSLMYRLARIVQQNALWITSTASGDVLGKYLEAEHLAGLGLLWLETRDLGFLTTDCWLTEDLNI